MVDAPRPEVEEVNMDAISRVMEYLDRSWCWATVKLEALLKSTQGLALRWEAQLRSVDEQLAVANQARHSLELAESAAPREAAINLARAKAAKERARELLEQRFSHSFDQTSLSLQAQNAEERVESLTKEL
ncbi:hypothetical protein QJS10_CPB15g00850 [Acorus calamus]|uniref:Uncharacterized protein n=1 Tax=Acorus calamus TaxID=4465 RepID=A0AAV9D6J4_ACOCL|nr:hypothetical protein QJS10_CPB15g00850 [Acorus calamus]